jgi:hypothetical protein
MGTTTAQGQPTVSRAEAVLNRSISLKLRDRATSCRSHTPSRKQKPPVKSNTAESITMTPFLLRRRRNRIALCTCLAMKKNSFLRLPSPQSQKGSQSTTPQTHKTSRSKDWSTKRYSTSSKPVRKSTISPPPNEKYPLLPVGRAEGVRREEGVRRGG